MQKEKGQIQIVIIGLIVIGGLIVLNLTGLLGGKKKSSPKQPAVQESEITTSTTSSIGPQRSNLYPNGTLPAGTRETTISVSTNEAAYCRYDQDPGTAYSSMAGSLGYNQEKTFHSIKITNLGTGSTYTYYIRCRNMNNMKNTDDAMIRFNVGFPNSINSPVSVADAKEIPPVISNLYPTGTLPGGTTETQIGVSTNEPAYCRYSTVAGTSYSSMPGSFSYDKAKLAHTIKVSGLTDNKIYEYYVRCRDMSDNKTTSDVIIKFGVGGVVFSPTFPQGQDITPPYRYKGYPDEDLTYSTKNTLMTLKTDEKAVCRYDSISSTNYGQMKRFDTTGDLLHSTYISGFNEGETYTYYIKCADLSNNINTDNYVVSFAVEKPDDATPPVITVLYPDDDLHYSTTETQLGVRTNEAASCRYSTEQGVSYNSMTKNFTKQDYNIHTTKITGLVSGRAYSYFVRCKDAKGNINTGDIMISFKVQQ